MIQNLARQIDEIPFSHLISSHGLSSAALFRRDPTPKYALIPGPRPHRSRLSRRSSTVRWSASQSSVIESGHVGSSQLTSSARSVLGGSHAAKARLMSVCVRSDRHPWLSDRRRCFISGRARPPSRSSGRVALVACCGIALHPGCQLAPRVKRGISRIEKIQAIICILICKCKLIIVLWLTGTLENANIRAREPVAS